MSGTTAWQLSYARTRWQVGPMAYLYVRRGPRMRRVLTVGGRRGFWATLTWRDHAA